MLRFGQNYTIVVNLARWCSDMDWKTQFWFQHSNWQSILYIL